MCYLTAAMSDKIVLYTFWRSSCAHRVRIALGFKRLSYRSVFVDLISGAQHAADYHIKSPTGYVPALEINNRVLVESVAILEYLEQVYPEPRLLPNDAFARAQVRSIVQMIVSGIQPLQNLNVLIKISDHKDQHLGSSQPINERGYAFARHYNERGLASIEATLAQLEAQGVTGPFCYGTQFGMADVVLGPQIAAARRFGVDLSKYPRVMRATNAADELDFVKAAAPEAQPDFPG